MVALKKWLKEQVVPELKNKGYNIADDKKAFMKCFKSYKTFSKFKKAIKQLKKDGEGMECGTFKIDSNVIDIINIKINETVDAEKKKKKSKKVKKTVKQLLIEKLEKNIIKLENAMDSGKKWGHIKITFNKEELKIVKDFDSQDLFYQANPERMIIKKSMFFSRGHSKQLIKALKKEKKVKKSPKPKKKKKGKTLTEEEIIEKKDFCDTWEENKKNVIKNKKGEDVVKNPKTKRNMKVGERTYKGFDKECKEIKELLKDVKVSEKKEDKKTSPKKTADKIFCEKWEENKKDVQTNKKGEEVVKNPKSNRDVKLGSRTFQNIEKKCEKIAKKEEEKIDDIIDIIKKSKKDIVEMKKDLKKELSKELPKKKINFKKLEKDLKKEIEKRAAKKTSKKQTPKKKTPKKTPMKKKNEFIEILDKVKNNKLTNKQIDDKLKELKLDNEKEYLSQIILIRLEQMA